MYQSLFVHILVLNQALTLNQPLNISNRWSHLPHLHARPFSFLPSAFFLRDCLDLSIKKRSLPLKGHLMLKICGARTFEANRSRLDLGKLSTTLLSWFLWPMRHNLASSHRSSRLHYQPHRILVKWNILSCRQRKNHNLPSTIGCVCDFSSSLTHILHQNLESAPR